MKGDNLIYAPGAAVKKGLAPASKLHFRCEDGAGDTLTDDVVGAQIVGAAGTMDWSIPNAVNNLSPMVPLPGKTPITNVGQWIEAQTQLNAGTLVFYVTLVYGLGVDAGTVQASLCDFTGSTSFPGGGYFVEPNTSTPTANASMKVSNWYAGATSPVTGDIDFAYNDQDLIIGDIADGNIITNCVKINFNKAPAAIYADSKGNVVNIGKTNTSSNRVGDFIIDWWRLYGDGVSPAYGALQSTFHQCVMYVEGMLHFQNEPTVDQMLECAAWHNVNSPKGNKDVWPGWYTQE